MIDIPERYRSGIHGAWGCCDLAGAQSALDRMKLGDYRFNFPYDDNEELSLVGTEQNGFTRVQ